MTGPIDGRRDRTRNYTESQVRRALIAYGEGKDFTEIAAFLTVSHFGEQHCRQVWKRIKAYGLKHGGGVPRAVRQIGIAEVREPEAISRHRRLRRGFDLPKSAEDKFIALLKSGLSFADAAHRVGASA